MKGHQMRVDFHGHSLAWVVWVFLFVLLPRLGRSDPVDTSNRDRLVAAARALSQKKTVYDAKYVGIAYPGGDVKKEVGVCSDLVIRAYRAIGIDFQLLLHDDIKKNWKIYPTSKRYGQKRPDRNIDHRRVANLDFFLKRKAQSLTLDLNKKDKWQPGDVVVFDLYQKGDTSHIGILSNRLGEKGLPLVFHHLPPHPAEDEALCYWPVLGHYRWLPVSN
jgi:uncharacterized protein YijF (DUF1287 family)